jgi:tetratricopeptide (TPR) repeat protein
MESMGARTKRVAVLALMLAVTAAGQGQPLEQAERLYQRTEYKAALALLKQQPRTAPVLYLEGRCWYHAGDFKQSVEALEKAVAADGRNAGYVNWLGKAWGRRAEQANIFRAAGFAGRARDAFEKAVELDPRRLEALNDLFQYYIEAPGIMGGGVDKAQSLLAKIKAVDTADFHTAQAQLARKRKDFAAEEAELRRAIAAAPNRPGKTADLARYLAQRGRSKESDALFAEAAHRWPEDKGLTFAHAETLVESKRDFESARKLLTRYLSMPLTPDDPSREDARQLLKRAGG